MTQKELLETLTYKPTISGFGGIITLMKVGDVTYDDHLILRQNEQGEWLVWQLVSPKFKVGDRIRAKDTTGDGSIIKSIDRETGCYVFDHDVKGSYVNMEYELVPYEPKDGDIVRKKGEDKQHYCISENVDWVPGQCDFQIWQIMDAGAAGSWGINRVELQREYVLVERRESLQQALDILKEQLSDALEEDSKEGIAQEVESRGGVTMKWEYKKTGMLDEAAMNKLGKVGWELVAAIGDKTGATASMFFKRQIKED